MKIPLVSSAGHGKADIKRIHYQEGAFALASTMCALFVKHEDEIRPRYLYILPSSMCGELLVPLKCGATNVSMSSSQVNRCPDPVPSPERQDEVIESRLIAAKARDLIWTASLLQDSSDRSVTKLAEHILSEAQELLKRAAKRTQIAEFVPSGSIAKQSSTDGDATNSVSATQTSPLCRSFWQFIPSCRPSWRSELCPELRGAILWTCTEDANGIAPKGVVELVHGSQGGLPDLLVHWMS